ncbi:hypothetical protein [Caldimonas brevitalea]|nr:hypothetical protein [Caldimonas brevitalea]
MALDVEDGSYSERGIYRDVTSGFPKRAVAQLSADAAAASVPELVAG